VVWQPDSPRFDAAEAARALHADHLQSSITGGISARERKQVYTHSTIFELGGPMAHNIYHPARQQAIVGELKGRIEGTKAKRCDVNVLSPADYRATMNAGHWVVTPCAPAGSVGIGGAASPPEGHAVSAMRPATEGYSGFAASNYNSPRVAAAATASQEQPAELNRAGSKAIFQFEKDADPVHVVRARRDSAIPREYWGTNSNLSWNDTRSAQANFRKDQEFHVSRKDMGAGERKRQEMSSEVFGTSRNMAKSTNAPTSELRATGMTDVHWTDSSLDRHVPEEQKKDAEEKRVMSARERNFKNLSISTGNMFPQRMHSAQSASPRSWKRTVFTVNTSEAPDVEARRRCERNYSDIFFDAPVSSKVSPSPVSEKKQITRGEPAGSTAASFLSPHAELIRRRKQQRGGAPEADGVAESVTMPAGKTQSPRSPRSPREKKLDHEERACYETSGLMEANAEIARRRRERTHPDGAPPIRLLSASERKRAELTSGQIRQGTGTSAALWDDGRSAGAPYSPKPSMHSRSCTDTSSYPRQGIRPQTARARKFEELMSQVVL